MRKDAVLTNQPPKEITTPPEGYEFAGTGTVMPDGKYAQWVGDRWLPATNMTDDVIGPVQILRKIKPPTVMVELPREAVEWLADNGNWSDRLPFMNKSTQACRKALEAENEA
jgi:hypothetical protein